MNSTTALRSFKIFNIQPRHVLIFLLLSPYELLIQRTSGYLPFPNTTRNNIYKLKSHQRRLKSVLLVLLLVFLTLKCLRGLVVTRPAHNPRAALVFIRL